MDLVLGRFGDPDPTPHTRGAPPPRSLDPVPDARAARAGEPPPGPQWTVGPDEVPDAVTTGPAGGSRHRPDDAHRVAPGGRLAPRLALIVAVAALLTGLSAVIHIGPFHSAARAATLPSVPVVVATDLRGSWSVLDTYAGAFSTATMHITTQNRSTGAFTGTITSAVGVERIKGTASGTAVSFTVSLGSGTEQGTGFISKSGSKTRIQGTFENSNGGRGSIVATRTAT